MSQADWIVLVATLVGIILYGLYKGRAEKNLDSYFLMNRSSSWLIILLGIIGTQASAVTFISAPGQSYTDGMRFVQYYFGLPLAMVVLCITFVPVFHKLKLFTAYEFLEKRFDGKTRAFTALLFLLQRGLSTGISISAPSIILSSLLGWNILWTNILMGGLLIIYTVTGGAKAVAYTADSICNHICRYDHGRIYGCSYVARKSGIIRCPSYWRKGRKVERDYFGKE